MDRPSLRDEMYAQTMKQLSSNTNVFSYMQGWRLLAIFTGHFAPSLDFLPYLIAFTKAFAPSFSGYSSSSGSHSTSSSTSTIPASPTSSSSSNARPPLPPLGTMELWGESARNGPAFKLTVPQACAVEGAYNHLINITLA